jgi:hypothetical protein
MLNNIFDLFLTKKSHVGDNFVSSHTVCLSIYLSVCLSIYLSIYGSAVLLLDLGRFFSFLIYTQSVELLGRGISPSQGRHLHIGQHK